MNGWMELLAGLMATALTQAGKDVHVIATGNNLGLTGVRFALAILSALSAILIVAADGQSLATVDWKTVVRTLVETGYIFLVAVGTYHGAVKPEKKV